jgi:SAM-dependent MidA family methyltransferase
MRDRLAYLTHAFQSRGGSMSFEDFMALALYDEQIGYYTVGIQSLGRSGDFSTAATLSPALGRAVAGWIEQEMRHHGWQGRLPLIEAGAGSGALAHTVLAALPWRIRRRVDYHIVEISAPLRAQQEKRLGKRAQWHESMEEALQAAEGRALCFSNELLDAFPAKLLRWRGAEQGWGEVWVEFARNTGLRESLHSLPTDLAIGDFSVLAWSNPPLGQRIEIQPAVLAWMRSWSPEWRRGSLLTVDYGGLAESLYQRRAEGSLRGYYRQQRIDGADIYRRCGEQDLTVDVNFTDIRQWGEQLGWETVSCETQRSFLTEAGAGSDPMAASEAGEAFHVLQQRRH